MYLADTLSTECITEKEISAPVHRAEKRQKSTTQQTKLGYDTLLQKGRRK
ncbi:uncharacterized protein PITG_11491 [Phytophthora infestans T30-4]|uniref:Uncharacterized protein n=1 Tax=Phytophthora infestans (strain T30-4) TaxID=403677 RepID=D0NIW7_PHYIT|nr:uncharacterized protein PITG_11491 [Phytophthora infestans T30-4]EEY59451.1 hypothetical protein PITG_11491 [Phytophthora infestans T30-4]|eukprot:XP_002901061.1 hypothetical protein PITG_11491 [Phytophthora infestans T30-4]